MYRDHSDLDPIVDFIINKAGSIRIIYLPAERLYERRFSTGTDIGSFQDSTEMNEQKCMKITHENNKNKCLILCRRNNFCVLYYDAPRLV